MNYSRRSISLPALHESFDSGLLNGGVLPNCLLNVKQKLVLSHESELIG